MFFRLFIYLPHIQHFCKHSRFVILSNFVDVEKRRRPFCPNWGQLLADFGGNPPPFMENICQIVFERLPLYSYTMSRAPNSSHVPFAFSKENLFHQRPTASLILLCHNIRISSSDEDCEWLETTDVGSPWNNHSLVGETSAS